MDEDKIYFNNMDQLLSKLGEALKDVDPVELRDVIFFLGNFRKEYSLPEGTSIYLTYFPLEGLEVVSGQKVSEVLVGGMKKFESLKYPEKTLPPIVVIKGGIREVMIYGEMIAVEAYGRGLAVRAIVFDLGEKDLFRHFRLDPTKTQFLIPLVQSEMERAGIPFPGTIS